MVSLLVMVIYGDDGENVTVHLVSLRSAFMMMMMVMTDMEVFLTFLWCIAAW